jgi:hypothetical protein
MSTVGLSRSSEEVVPTDLVTALSSKKDGYERVEEDEDRTEEHTWPVCKWTISRML